MTEHATSHTLDGNAAAGCFTEIFGIDVTAVSVTCIECQGTAAFAEQRAFLAGPGTVLRCRGCDHVLARVVDTTREVWLDLSGSATWRFPTVAPKFDDSQPQGM